MNYLAHIYLSGDDTMVAIGNFIADGIKGKKYERFDKKLQLGILLHRQIDYFTDTHPVVRQSSKRLHQKYSHYAGVIVDIFYDHFLAKHWKNYSNTPLHEYVDQFYQVLKVHYEILPMRIQHMLPYMTAENWLLNYASKDGIATVLNGMNKRTKYKSGMHLAIEDLNMYYDDFQQEFTLFFNDLMDFSEAKRKELQQKLKI